MFDNVLTTTAGPVKVKLEERNNRSRSKFRHFSRQVCGEVFDVSDNNQVIFSYEEKYQKSFQTGQMSFSLADLSMVEPEDCFDTEYFPQISFLFVHRDFQCQGFGSLLIKEGIKIIKDHCNFRPLRLQSARDSLGFFEKCGFHIVAEPYECWHTGSRLFKTLVNMQMDLK